MADAFQLLVHSQPEVDFSAKTLAARAELLELVGMLQFKTLMADPHYRVGASRLHAIANSALPYLVVPLQVRGIIFASKGRKTDRTPEIVIPYDLLPGAMALLTEVRINKNAV